MNPESFMIINAVMKKRGAGTSTAIPLFNLLLLGCDNYGEIVSNRSALSNVLDVNLKVITAATRILCDVGLIEYRRGSATNLYRINPAAVSTGRKYYHEYRELVDQDSGEVFRKREVGFSEDYKKLLRRYGGKELDKKLIAAEINILDSHTAMQAIVK